LGFWQLARATEKKSMMAAFTELMAQAPTSFSQGYRPKQYEALEVSGHYLPINLLLDNQQQQHQFGYDVLTPLLLPSGLVILIDRGWVKGDMGRKQYPHLAQPQTEITVRGSVYYPSERVWTLGEIIEKKMENLVVIEKIDTTLITQLLHKSVYPFIIRLEKEDAHGFLRQWRLVSMPPERHIAYAYQWFAMALCVLFIFLGLSIQKKS